MQKSYDSIYIKRDEFMKIEKICINGVGGIKYLELKFNKGMNLICGTNGIGKTTILECISHLFIANDTSQLKRNVNCDKGNVEAELEIDGQNRSYNYEINDFEPDKKDFVSAVEIEKSKDIIVFNPIRSFDYIKLESISRDPERDSYTTRNIAYEGVSATDIKDWFIQRYLWSAHKNYLNKEQIYNLKCSKKLFSILDKEITFSKIKPDTFDILLNTRQGEIFFEYLSSGYKSCVYILLGIIKEIEYRYKNPYIKVKDFNGIILIDEIDVHLHPEWQARLVNALKELLPNAQIIATTHSPSIIQTAETNQIIALYFDENNDICIKELEQKQYGYQGWTIEEILKDVMGMEETMSSLYEKTSKEFEKAINEENIKTAKECYKILNKMLHPQNYLRKILEIQMVGMGDENDKDK